ncbi:TPA: hypothetical protein ACH3X1_014630 [Trebouxia sp. C0004]
MQRFLQFRLGSHQLPIVLGRFAGAQHVARANRVCTHCGSVAVADELHMIFECPALQSANALATLSNGIRGPTCWNLAPWVSSFARWYWLSSLVSWLSAFLCWLVIALPNFRANSEDCELACKVVVIGRVTHPKGPLSFKAFVRGDISSLLPFRLASFSTLSRCGAQLHVGVMSTPRSLCACGVVSMQALAQATIFVASAS